MNGDRTGRGETEVRPYSFIPLQLTDPRLEEKQSKRGEKDRKYEEKRKIERGEDNTGGREEWRRRERPGKAEET